MSVSFNFRRGFTLIELLIVVAIIAVLAAIAVPNLLEAQTRSKVSRVKADMRSVSTAIEAYSVDNNTYPEGSDNAANYPAEISAYLGALAPGYYGFRTRGAGGLAVGRDFAGITTPIAYITSIPTDPFAAQASKFFTYCYRSAKDKLNGYVMTSAGPDLDLLAAGGKGNNKPTNKLSTSLDPKNPSRLGDVNEREVIAFIEGSGFGVGTVADMPDMGKYLLDLSYDPTNGTVSDGDILYVGPGSGFAWMGK